MFLENMIFLCPKENRRDTWLKKKRTFLYNIRRLPGNAKFVCYSI